MEYKTVRVKEILDDDFFRFSSRIDTTAIKRSIQNVGVQSPLTVIPVRGGCRPVAGFKRLEAARSLGIDTVPARWVKDTDDLKDVFKGVIEEQLSIRDLNLVEKARVIEIFSNIGTELGEISKELIDLLQLPPHMPALQRVLDLMDFTPAVLQYIQKYGLSIRQTECFQNLSDDEQNSAVDMANRLGLRGVELAEILYWIRDIRVRENQSFEAIVRNDRIDELLNDAETPRSQRVYRFKEILKKQRYPKLHRWNQRLEDLRNSLHLPEEAKMSWDRSLEAEGIQLNLVFRSMEQVDALIEVFTNKTNRRNLEKMFKDVRN